MGSISKRARRRQKAQESLEKEASHSKQVKRPQPDSDPEEDHEILFPKKTRETVVMPSSPERVLEVPDCGVDSVTIMVKTLNDAIAAVSQDTAQIQRAYQQLADLTAMVREYGSSPAATRLYGSPTPTGGPHPAMQTDVLDEDGNLRAADIGITWADNETFLHGVRVVGTTFSRPTGQEPVMSTPYPGGRNDDRGPSPMTGRPTSPETFEFGPETIPIARPAGDHPHRPATEARQGYRLAAPIQRFNNKSLNWPAWFRHFRAVAGPETRRQRPLQLRRAGKTLGRPIRPSIESVGFPLSVSRQIAPPS